MLPPRMALVLKIQVRNKHSLCPVAGGDGDPERRDRCSITWWASQPRPAARDSFLEEVTHTSLGLGLAGKSAPHIVRQ